MIYLICGVINFMIGFNTTGFESVFSYSLFILCAIGYAIESNKKENEPEVKIKQDDDRSEIDVLLDNPEALEKMVDDAIEEMKEELAGTEKGLQLLEMMEEPEAMQELREATMEALIGELR